MKSKKLEKRAMAMGKANRNFHQAWIGGIASGKRYPHE
jgi:hypothetical protein